MNDNTLSPEGQTRKSATLGELQLAVRARRRRRRMIQSGAIALPLLGLAAGSFVMLRAPSTQAPTTPQLADRTTQRPNSPAFQLRHISFTQASTPPSQEDRSISDDELLKLLRAAGHDAGLVRRDGDVRLTGVDLQAPTDEPETPNAGA